MRLSPLVAVAGVLLSAAPLGAVPAYARQTGFACSQCHSQHFPSLNEFGRHFKLDGFTLIGNSAKVEGTRLSLPAGLNASLFLKLRLQKTNGDDAANARSTNSGELQFPDEFALLLAGRVSENIGFILEGQLPTGGAAVLASFKMPFSYEVGRVQASVIPYTTDALGASYGFELLNTGAVRNIRFMEHRNDFSAQQYVGTATAASGAAFVVGNQRFFANLSVWSPIHLAAVDGLASPLPRANYARLAFLPKVGKWDVGFGGQAWFGTARVDDGSGNGTVTSLATKAWAVDAQAQGQLGKMPLGVFASYASSAASDAGEDPNVFNGGPRARKAFAISGELGVLPERGSVLLAYRHGDTGAASNHQDRALTVGGIYHLHQNVQFQVNYTFRSGDAFDPQPANGDQLLTAMLAAAF
ncbi:MAG: hypothetical protein IPI38_00610 [Gemmatimonadetes bacterium]|nr:hypothetical protein [Gemmatimonadota bacterium]MBP9199963.1 hypothetical protein [Gemmatimonadales bacterium]MBK6779334.1 hypothetical protein [Gemmatimonadota bacterium]MBK7348353.1 hypothetical protein [Gemmatimonadota bacterium]MBK7713924.1 hypothetical protein [Gemmatimonadota bacterium]